MTDPLTCIICGETFKNELVAYHDGNATTFHDKPVCIDCCREIAMYYVKNK